MTSRSRRTFGFSLTAALLTLPVLQLLHGCGDELASGPTSVFLTIKNGPGAPVPSIVNVSTFFVSATGSMPGKNQGLGVTMPRGNVLGDLVVLAPAGSKGLTVRFEVRGLIGGVIVSTGQKQVMFVDGRQVRTELLLSVPVSDAGVDSSGSVGGADGAGGAGGTDGAAGAGDTAMLDAAVPRKATGEVCANANECTSGSCKDQVCCDVLCPGSCHGCKVAGLPVGQCSPLPQGTTCMPNACQMGNRQLARYACNPAASCIATNTTCATRMCDAVAGTCN